MRTGAWKAAFFVAFLASGLLLLAPGSALPRVEPFPQVDKVEHALAFAALALLAVPAYPGKPRWGVWVALALWGGATELAQRDIPGRTADVLDWVADAVGALAVLAHPRRA